MTILITYIYLMLYYAIQTYIWVIIIYCIAGFFVRNRYAGWYRFLQELVGPPLSFIRRATGNRLVIERFDLSPIVLILALKLLGVILANLFH